MRSSRPTLGDSVIRSNWTRFSVHTAVAALMHGDIFFGMFFGGAALATFRSALPLRPSVSLHILADVGLTQESKTPNAARVCQLGNATVGAAEPPTELAVNILQHHHVGVDVGLVICVEVSGRELVQHGCAVRDDGC
jgi:hypothetical protein